jgi:YD repeat-containing protein
MRTVTALSVIMVFCLAAAGQAHKGKMAGKTEATVVSVDNAGKTVTVKNKAGKETVLTWDDSTKLEGTLKEGETIHYKAHTMGGKTMATWIHVGAMEKMSTTKKSSSPTKY